MAPWGQVHRQVNVATQRPESGRMEPPDGSDVTRHWPDGQVLKATGAGLLNGPVDEPAADALTTDGLGDDDGLDLAACAPVEQTGQAGDLAVKVGYPESGPVRHGQVIVEAGAGVMAAD